MILQRKKVLYIIESPQINLEQWAGGEIYADPKQDRKNCPSAREIRIR